MELTRLTRSLSRFELGVCVVIIALLFIFAIRKISELSVYTEQTGVRIIIRNMQSNLDLYKSDKMITGTLEEMAGMIHANPVNIIIPPPQGYRGEYNSPDPEQFSPGDWYFDINDGYLVYIVSHPDRFISPVSPPARIRLRLEPVYQDLNSNNIFDQPADRLTGLSLKSPATYEWR